MKAAHVVLLLAALTGATTCLLWRKYIYVNMSLPWTEAQTYCRKHYVDLLTIDAEEELSRFKSDVEDDLSDQSWIGLTKTPDQSVFSQWSDGSAFGFAVWKPGEPDALNTQTCVTVWSAEYSTFYCTVRLPFICYRWEPTLFVVQEMKTWFDALVYCRTQYTDLISLSTDIDLFAVNNQIGNIQNASMWTGLNFLDGSWFWVNNEPLMNPYSLPSCPILPLRCGAKVGVQILENRNCSEKMTFICYSTDEGQKESD